MRLNAATGLIQPKIFITTPPCRHSYDATRLLPGEKQSCSRACSIRGRPKTTITDGNGNIGVVSAIQMLGNNAQRGEMNPDTSTIGAI